MQPHPRYQPIDVIAHGDFATLYRGFDAELDREVAIKQIHPQFLADPQQLERYWREAKLLAGLEHPYIMTIYDIVRERGWLILELMQGSLQQRLQGRPIDLEDLRLTLIYMSHALGFLHQNGIVHGDVKPSNLLLDKNHRVKLGDFGIARRLHRDEGSVVKGTTKYMAPEVVSDQFGAVGHHSDLYSLGFSAYELLCGEQFESLFPGLHMQGRDPQIAWMMWHGARDRQAPAIDKVLEGVPPELARVIQKLIRKEPTERYASAEQVVFDLKSFAEGKDPDELLAKEEQQRQEQTQKRKRRRNLATLAVVASLMLSAGMLMLPAEPQELSQVVGDYPKAGEIVAIDLERGLLGIADVTTKASEVTVGKAAASAADPRVEGIELDAERDRIFINGTRAALTDLQLGDEVQVERVIDSGGRTQFLVEVTRQTIEQVSGEVLSVDPAHGEIRLKISEVRSQTKTPGAASRAPETEDDDADALAAASRSFYVPASTPILFNGREQWSGKKQELIDLLAGDQARVEFVPGQEKPEVRKLYVTRSVELTGQLHTIDLDRGELSLRISAEHGEQIRTLPLSRECVVSLNGVTTRNNGQRWGLRDLRADDEIVVRHDDEVRQIAAVRDIVSRGTVVENDVDQRRLTVKLDDPTQVVIFRVSDHSLIGLEQDGTARPLDYLRAGDRVAMEHLSVDLVDPIAEVVRIEPQPNNRCRVLLIGFDQYDDPQVTTDDQSKGALRELAITLRDAYRLPSQHVQTLINPTRLTIQNRLAQWQDDGLASNMQVVVVVSSRAFRLPEMESVLATREFELRDPLRTGLTLRDLLDPLETLEGPEVMLFLDGVAESETDDAAANAEELPGVEVITAAEFVEASRLRADAPLSPRVTIFAEGETRLSEPATGQMASGRSLEVLQLAYSGAADGDGDHQVDSTELAAFLTRRAGSGERDLQQAPISVYLPDDAPPRLLAATEEQVLELLALSRQPRYPAEMTTRFAAPQRLQPEQPDVLLAYGFAHLQHNRTAESREAFQEIVAAFPGEPMAALCLAWQELLAKDSESATRLLNRCLARLVHEKQPMTQSGRGVSNAATIPKQVPETVGPQEVFDVELAFLQQSVPLIARLATYAEACSERPPAPETVERLARLQADLSAEERGLFRQTRAEVLEKREELDSLWREASSEQKAELDRQRTRLSSYVHLVPATFEQYLRQRLNPQDDVDIR